MVLGNSSHLVFKSDMSQAETFRVVSLLFEDTLDVAILFFAGSHFWASFSHDRR